jgi:2-keto-4-pentenoate hydratase/2-oxohepta-3-ene-1,7-dioic acid hydratase in catechol pathway
LSYVLGYTAANDVSSRKSQLAQSQACYSKGFDGSCPLGPVLVSASLIPNPADFTIRGSKNGEVVQNSSLT